MVIQILFRHVFSFATKFTISFQRNVNTIQHEHFSLVDSNSTDMRILSATICWLAACVVVLLPSSDAGFTFISGNAENDL